MGLQFNESTFLDYAQKLEYFVNCGDEANALEYAKAIANNLICVDIQVADVEPLIANPPAKQLDLNNRAGGNVMGNRYNIGFQGGPAIPQGNNSPVKNTFHVSTPNIINQPQPSPVYNVTRPTQIPPITPASQNKNGLYNINPTPRIINPNITNITNQNYNPQQNIVSPPAPNPNYNFQQRFSVSPPAPNLTYNNMVSPQKIISPPNMPAQVFQGPNNQYNPNPNTNPPSAGLANMNQFGISPSVYNPNPTYTQAPVAPGLPVIYSQNNSKNNSNPINPPPSNQMNYYRP